jgi:hypothetical protein
MTDEEKRLFEALKYSWEQRGKCITQICKDENVAEWINAQNDAFAEVIKLLKTKS